MRAWLFSSVSVAALLAGMPAPEDWGWYGAVDAGILERYEVTSVRMSGDLR